MMKIPVSSINQYLFCPRSVYLKEVLGVNPQPSAERNRGLIGHAVRKELSLRQSRILGKLDSVDEIRETVLSELEGVLGDAPYIYRNLLDGFEVEGFISKIRSELLDEIGFMEEKIKVMVDEIGFKESLKRVTPWRVEYPVKSDKLMLSGRVDKVMQEDGFFPVEIKTGNLGDGVWMGDRMQTCAYSMLLEEDLGLNKAIPFGFVEYTRIHEKRPVSNTEYLRRRVLAVRDEVIEVFEGKNPVCPSGSEKKCRVCGFKDRCYDEQKSG